MTAIEPVHDVALVPAEQRQLQATWRQAQRLAATNLVPDALRGKPNDTLAVILYGASYGLAPAHAVSQLWVIKGRIVPSSQVLAGVAMRAGHRVRIKDSSSESCTVSIRRREDADDPDGWQATTFTVEDAKRAGLMEKPLWKQWTADMLAHATMRRAVKRVCADALLGIDDGGDEGIALEDVARRTPPAPPRDPDLYDPGAGGATLTLSADGVIRSTPADESSGDGSGGRPSPQGGPSPGEFSDGGDLCEGTQPTGHVAPPSEPITEPMMKKVHALMGHRGILGNARHTFVSERLGREVTTLKDVTKDEGRRLIDWLEAAEQEGAPT